ncbi:MAG: hypothetical protein V3V05_11680 [Pontiella sp.]
MFPLIIRKIGGDISVLHAGQTERVENADLRNEDCVALRPKRYTPREWFIAPLEVIEQAIALIISGEIVICKYDSESKFIVKK